MSNNKVKISICIDEYMEEYMKKMRGGSKAEKLRRLIDDGIQFRERLDAATKAITKMADNTPLPADS